jgi:hypothetical protein
VAAGWVGGSSVLLRPKGSSSVGALDVKLLRAWELFETDDGPTAEEEKVLLPPLISAGYVEFDDRLDAWSFTPAGVKRAGEIEADPHVEKHHE